MTRYRQTPASIVLLTLAACVCCAANAASDDCAAAGKVPALRVAAGDVAGVAATIRTLPWSGGDKLQVETVRVVTGGCLASVAGFAPSFIRLQGNLAVQVTESGEISAARAVPREPPVPNLAKEESHGDHTHSDSGIGEFVAATRIATAGTTEYFLGLWKQKQGSLLAVLARQTDGVMSQPAPLLGSSLPVRAVSYTPQSEGSTGTIGITQEADGELRLISVQWSHRDFGR